MIKFLGQGQNGHTILILGLDAENLRRLDKEPIFVDGAETGGIPVDVFLMAGETAAEIVRTLQKGGIQVPASALVLAEAGVEGHFDTRQKPESSR